MGSENLKNRANLLFLDKIIYEGKQVFSYTTFHYEKKYVPRILERPSNKPIPMMDFDGLWICCCTDTWKLLIEQNLALCQFFLGPATSGANSTGLCVINF